MKNIKVTLAALRSILIDPNRNLELVKEACQTARRDGARLLLLPEMMLTGHGGHSMMEENAEPVPEGPLSQAVLELSKEYQLCICVGIAELADGMVYNSQMVVDKGVYLGLQRKINMSGDEYRYFACGERVEVFDIGDIRFGVTICYDNNFPEIAFIHHLHKVDLILAAHAARTGEWPDPMTTAFRERIIAERQNSWEKMFRGTAYFHNLYILACNAVGSSTEGLEGVVSNHAGTVMGVDPTGEVFLRTSVSDFVDEVVTVELEASKRVFNHKPTRNRRLPVVKRMLNDAFQQANEGV
ncbi:MAG: carbon-nitrogen hydrolase family protein [Fidelibacterota bacterium]|nr:MAG: carbon-nitrogen hydrolase family protein [Candidatus Neomarinimicrobiota bacterium]